MTKIKLKYADGAQFTQIFVNNFELKMYIAGIKKKCIENNIPFPDITYDEWEN